VNEYAERLVRDRRLVILRVLAEVPGYALNSSILMGILRDYGHTIGRDTAHADLAWLEEQGLVSVDVVAENLHRAELTQRGDDIAAGRSHIPGVKRPGPGG